MVEGLRHIVSIIINADALVNSNAAQEMSKHADTSGARFSKFQIFLRKT